jgi:hypothetical protein
MQPPLTQGCPADVDDVCFDGVRQRVYLIGGEGRVAVFALLTEGSSSGLGTDMPTSSPTASAAPSSGGRYSWLGSCDSAVGARTGVWVAERHRLYVAAPATAALGARLLVYEALD